MLLKMFTTSAKGRLMKAGMSSRSFRRCAIVSGLRGWPTARDTSQPATLTVKTSFMIIYERFNVYAWSE
jgi:hypothetical protein